MGIKGTLARLTVACTVAIGATIATPALADPLPGTMRELSSEYPISIEQYTQAGMIVPNASVESKSPGPISYSYCFTGSPSCASGQSDVELGSDPTLSAFVHTTCDEAYPCSHSDDYSRISSGSVGILDYAVELVDIGKTAAESVKFNAADIINLTGESGASYSFSITGITTALKMQDCQGEIDCAEGVPIGPISSITSVMLVPNNVYYVSMQLYTEAYGHTGDSAYASLDPTFSLPPGSTGTLIYSPGMMSGVPEPAVWMMMLIGFGMVGGLIRHRRNAGSVMRMASIR